MPLKVFFQYAVHKVMELTLLVMAAGMGARYGGLKQLYTFGPHEEAIIDYSIYDAIHAGFSKIVFVIRKEIEKEFTATILKRISPPHIKIEVAYQEIDSYVPKSISITKDRKKPWGTGHAVLAARDKIQEPFAVINADDFYGRTSYQVIANFLRNNPTQYALVGYQLKKTLSENGFVSRGICNIDSSGNLQSINEHTKIVADPEHHFIDWQPDGKHTYLTGNETVSLNLWGFQPAFFDFLGKKFEEFLKIKGQDANAEFYLPAAVDAAINENVATFAVLPTPENWFGITYKEDAEKVKIEIQNKLKLGEYPENLWLSGVSSLNY